MATGVRDAASATTARYTVPAGRVAIVRSVDLWIYSVGLVYFGLPGPGLFMHSSLGAPATGISQWRGDQVFVAGETFGCVWVSGNMSVMASGFLLSA